MEMDRDEARRLSGLMAEAARRVDDAMTELYSAMYDMNTISRKLHGPCPDSDARLEELGRMSVDIGKAMKDLQIVGGPDDPAKPDRPGE